MRACWALREEHVDRFIIATARLHDLTVVTHDEKFAQYGVTVLS
mgnify:CR=1 FL=1